MKWSSLIHFLCLSVNRGKLSGKQVKQIKKKSNKTIENEFHDIQSPDENENKSSDLHLSKIKIM